MRLQTKTERNGITSGHHIAYLFVNFFDHNKDRSLWAVERYMDEKKGTKSSFRVIVAEHCRSIYVPLMIKRHKIQVRNKTSCFATPPHRIYSSPFKGNRFVPLHCTPSSPSNPIKMMLIRHSSFSAHYQGDSKTGRSQGLVELGTTQWVLLMMTNLLSEEEVE